MIHKRSVAASPTHKKKRSDPGSNVPVKYLSPSSQVARLHNGTIMHGRLHRALFKAENATDLRLTKEQKDEMSQLVMAVQEKEQKELEAIIEEAESTEEGNGGVIQDVWDQDLSNYKKFWGPAEEQ